MEYKYKEIPLKIIGETFENNANQKYEVISESGRSKSNGIKYLIRFIETGYERVVERIEIKRGKIKDKLSQSVYGVGYIGNVKMVDHKNVYGVWSAMLDRCYNKDNKSYHAYGGKGASVCEKWHCFENFLNDLKHIDGYDENLFNEGLLHLDKDKKQIDMKYGKIYSLETCSLISIEENSSYANHDKQKLSFYGLSPNGEIFEIFGITEFAKTNNLQKTHVSSCLKGKAKTHKGWKFSANKNDLI